MADQDAINIVLCQDCLAIAPYTNARHQEREFCVCGGQWCGCASCNETAAKLLSGVRDGQELGLVETGKLKNWDASNGTRPTDEPGQ